MPPFINTWLESLVTEAGILKRAPGAALALAIVVALPAVAFGWWLHSNIYTAALSAKDDRINGLKDENDQLRKQLSHQPKILSDNDPDAIYQNGKKIGSVEVPTPQVGEGRYGFKILRASADFNPMFGFVYRGMRMKISNNPSFGSMRSPAGSFKQYFDVECQLIELN